MNNRKSFTKSVLKTSEYATDMEDESIYDINEFIDSGNYAFNILLSGKIDGGFPVGKVTTISGETHTGKSILMMKAMIKFLNKHEDNIVILYETEGSVFKEVISEELRDRFLVFPVNTVEEFSTLITKHVELYKKDFEEEIKNKETRVLFALDSLGNLAIEKEVKDVNSGSGAMDMGIKSKLLKRLGRTLCLELSKIRTALICTNHIYANPNAGMYAQRKDKYAQAGGKGFQYLSSIIIYLSKTYEKEKIGKKAKVATKAKVKAILDKSRLVKEDMFVRITIDFNKGISKFSGIIESLLEFDAIEKINQMTYKFLNFSGKKLELAQYIVEILKDETHPDRKALEDKLKDIYCFGNMDLSDDSFSEDEY